MLSRRIVSAAVAAGLGFGLASYADAQTPKRGGVVVAGYESGDPPNFDCHGTAQTLSTIYFLEPHYSMLLRFDVKNYPKIEGDVAESWTVSPDGLTYAFKLRPNVTFHDGSPMTAADIKATYDRIYNPPQGVLSMRKPDFSDIESITVNDPLNVTFKLSRPNAAMLSNFTNPFNCIYSARRLAESQQYPLTNIMGTGPFAFVELQRGREWVGKRFDGYFRPGQPYLDGFKILLLSPNSGPTAFSGGQLDMFLRVLSPQEVDSIKAVRGDKARFSVTSVVTSTQITFNASRKPFDDVRVRKALSLAIDRRGGMEPISKITNQIAFGTIMRPGSEMALSDQEVEQIPGFSRDINAQRAEARRLLAEAGQSNLNLKVVSRPINPFQQLAVFAIDQWRQVGVTGEMISADATQYLALQNNKDYDAALTANSLAAEDPTTILARFVPGLPVNTGHYQDQMLVDLFEKQKVTLNPVERKKLINEFDKRMGEQAYIASMFWAGWTSVVQDYVHGWQPTPLYYLGYDMGAIWRD